MALHLVLTDTASAAIVDALRYSQETFGEAAMERYRILIETGLAELLEDPERPNTKARDDIDVGVRLYHLRHVKQPGPERHVGAPRHFIAYCVTGQALEILHLLHERMHIKAQLKDHP